MKQVSKRALLAAMAGLLLVLGQAAAKAETVEETRARIEKLRPKGFPSKPIEMMVAYPVGGGMDVIARFTAKAMQKYTDATIFVNNRVGASGLLGHNWLNTQAPSDGHVMAFTGSPMWSDAFLRAEGKWKWDNVEPVGFVNSDPTYWLVSTSGRLATKSLKEVLELTKAKPGFINLGTSLNILPDFLVDGVELAGGIKFHRVPINGSAPGFPLLIEGSLDISYGYASDFQGHVDSGRMRVLGLSGPSRSSRYPEVATFNEALGRQDLMYQVWRYIGLPRGIPDARRTWLVAVIQAGLNDRDLLADFDRLGSNAPRDRLNTPRDVAAEAAKLAELERQILVRTGKIKE